MSTYNMLGLQALQYDPVLPKKPVHETLFMKVVGCLYLQTCISKTYSLSVGDVGQLHLPFIIKLFVLM